MHKSVKTSSFDTHKIFHLLEKPPPSEILQHTEQFILTGYFNTLSNKKTHLSRKSQVKMQIEFGNLRSPKIKVLPAKQCFSYFQT